MLWIVQGWKTAHDAFYLFFVLPSPPASPPAICRAGPEREQWRAGLKYPFIFPRFIRSMGSMAKSIKNLLKNPLSPNR